jgi:beta-lactamase superfamily II metal-dependent hydrolase
MATKKTTRKTPTKRAKIERSAHGTTRSAQKISGVKVRMYRQGLGDCFLITLPKKDGTPYYIMIDCGVILGTSDAATKMQDVVNNIISTTGGRVDLLLATHEHWDHLSGFVQARDVFKGLKVDNVWLAWTEDPKDDLANELRSEHMKMRMALSAAAARMRFGAGGSAAVDSLMEFFGAAGQGTTGDALKVVKAFSKTPRFCLPSDDPVELQGIDARLYILGPPHDKKMIKKFNPSEAHPETYGMAALYMGNIAPAITAPDLDAPFDPIAQIPLELAQQMPFFQARYWGEDTGSEEKDQSWRRIDGDWLDSSSSMALQLDSATNNTSLVLAIELGSGQVLLFVADAQVGNWLSWRDLSWQVDGKTVTGPDLLARTILYKVGHHGSHNATLREKGLELMKNLEIALIPVDHQMALKKRWGKMPLDEIEKTLNEMTNGAVLRVDRDVPPALEKRVAQGESKELYFEVTV